MLTAKIGPDYRTFPLAGVKDCKLPTRAIQDHGLRGIMNACSHESQVDRALESTMRLYPPLVCTAKGRAGGVTIPVIQN